jgi:hybrid cluster-associated redox disulfide protein
MSASYHGPRMAATGTMRRAGRLPVCFPGKHPAWRACPWHIATFQCVTPAAYPGRDWSKPLRHEVAPRQRASREGALASAIRTETPMFIADDDLVDEVMRGAPRTIRVFLAFQMGCVGCPLACFHTVADACREHHLDRDFSRRCATAPSMIRTSGSRLSERIMLTKRAEDQRGWPSS